MTPSILARTLVRRWYVALVGLILTGALGGAAIRLVPPEYEAAGSILLLPPVERGANPYLDLAAVPGVPEVIARILHDSKYADAYEQDGIKDYEVTPDQSAGGPAVLVIGRGSTDDQALRSMLTVMSDVMPVLQSLQDDAGVDRQSLITGRQIYVETEATKLGKKQTRALIAAVGAGLVLTLFLVFAVDALLGRLAARRARREGSGHDDRDAGDDGDEDDDPPPSEVDEDPPGARAPEPPPGTEPRTRPGTEPEPTPGVPAPVLTSGSATNRTSRRSSKRSPKRPAKRPGSRPARPVRASDGG